MPRTLLRPVDREIWRLAIPAFAALVAEPIYLMADSAIVGHLGTPQLAGLGIAGTVLTTLLGLFIFLAYGTTSAVARQLGAGDLRAALAQGIDGIWLALGLGAVTLVAGVAGAPWLIGFFGPSPEVAGYAETYLRISAFGLPGMFAVFAATGVLRGLQDTKTPLYVAVTANLANVVLNVTFVYGLGLGIGGAALGTAVAQTAGAVWLCSVVVRGARSHGAPLRPDLPGIRAAGRTGVPLIVRTLTLRIALVTMTYVATAQGDVAIAAHQIAFTLWTFLMFALDALAIAAQAMTGKFLGASDAAGARAVTRRLLGWGLGAGVFAGLVLLAASPVIGALFTGDQAVQHLLTVVLVVSAIQQPVAGIVFVLDGVLIGAGDNAYLAWAGVFTLVCFLPLAGWVYAASAGLVALWWAYNGFMVARLVTLVWRERSDRWLVVGGAR